MNIKEFISNLFEKWTCKHDWELIHKLQTYEASSTDLPYKITFYYKCKKCGKFKKLVMK